MYICVRFECYGALPMFFNLFFIFRGYTMFVLFRCIAEPLVVSNAVPGNAWPAQQGYCRFAARVGGHPYWSSRDSA